MNLHQALVQMQAEFEAHRLTVWLAPCKTFANQGGMIRVVVDQNAKWYRQLCAKYPTNRWEGDTQIKRANISRVLERLVQGLPSRSKYVHDLFSLAREILKMNITAKSDRKQNIQFVIPEEFNGLVLVGDVPYDEVAIFPFQNSHYGTVKDLVREAGLDLAGCIQCNLLPYYPENGFLTPTHAIEINETLARLLSLHQTTTPFRAVVFLGRPTLRWVKPGADNVDAERGAPFRWNGVPSLATYHPREIYLEYHNRVVVAGDFAKAVKYSREGWKEPEFAINYQPSYPECVNFLHWLIEKKPYISTDWESQHSVKGRYSVATCIGFGINEKKAFVIPFVKEGNKHHFTLEEEINIWRLVARALETCPQLGHNATQYDHWFAAYWNKILMHVVDDTMFAQWEVYTELEKSLSFCASIYLDVPYWKNELELSRAGKIPRNREFLYNGRDCCITHAVAGEIGKEFKELPPEVRQHYKFNIRCSRIFQYMSLRGCFVDRDKLRTRIAELTLETEAKQRLLEDTIKQKLKVTSPKQMKEWLYGKLRLPVKTKLVKNEETGEKEERDTADFLAVAYLAREYPDIPGLMLAATLRKLYKRLSSLGAIQLGPQGQCYWNFNLVGTETGRASGYKPNNGLGVQPQNVDRRDRDLFSAGPGLLWAKCDLEGADAWTVAGQLSTLGDDTMLRDLRAKLKPAQILALANIVGEHVMDWNQAALVDLLKQHKPFLKTKEGKQIYDTAKAVSHGTNYMMQATTMHVTIFQKSKAELYVPVRDCEKLRQLYLRRYRGLEQLYSYIPTIINNDGAIDCPSGMHRVFFGRADNHRTRVGLALIPQNNTAYATNRFLYNLFYQRFNRRPDGRSLIVEPLNQVHDEADLAFRVEELEKVRDIFNLSTDFDSEVWGVHFKIPFDPNYGESWGNCDNPLFGED